LGILEEQIKRCIHLIEKAKRPVIILGWGIRLAQADVEARELVENLGFPVVPTWAMLDFLPADHPLFVGTFGTHGTRYGNFAVQNADLVLAIGARLDTREAGSPHTDFAREAKKIVVDIDPNELIKFSLLGMKVDVLINANAKDFLQLINQRLIGLAKQDFLEWKECINNWKKKYPICPREYYAQEEVNPYVFVKALSKESAEGDVIFLDTGCALAWTMQAFECKAHQRLFHDFNNTAMGYALPASIGACFALDKKPIICVTGDGALQMNIQELATVVRHQLPIKIFLINNHGYSMIQQTQDQWFDSRYLASTIESGLAFPDFVKVADAYGYKTLTINHNREVRMRIREALDSDGPVLCNVEISPKHKVIPQVKYGRPIEDGEPLLDRREFLENMIVKPAEASLR
ncbi:MAG: thiamine pyrophosphate-binding protein, partial [Halobacteria archaeon]